jgi:hypothetical protein
LYKLRRKLFNTQKPLRIRNATITKAKSNAELKKPNKLIKQYRDKEENSKHYENAKLAVTTQTKKSRLQRKLFTTSDKETLQNKNMQHGQV